MPAQDEENVVIMDGPGPFYFGRLDWPISLLPGKGVDAVAIQGEIEVDETGKRVTVRIPMADAEARTLMKLLQNYLASKVASRGSQ